MKTGWHRNLFLIFVTFFFGAACDPVQQGIKDYLTCDGNETRQCNCANGEIGIQLCDPDSAQWDVCVCQSTPLCQQELCGDGIDNDCDGLVDEEGPRLFFDADSDGYGNAAEAWADTDGSTDYTCDAIPVNYTHLIDDCKPNDPNHWNDCEMCFDPDSDGYGPGCDQGTDDCDNAAATGAGCHIAGECTYRFHDKDGDGYLVRQFRQAAVDNAACRLRGAR